MKVSTSVSLKIPSVQFGSIDLFSSITIDSEVDKAAITKSAKRLGIAAKGTGAEVLAEVSRRMAIEEIQHMKSEVDKVLEASTYKLAAFSK